MCGKDGICCRINWVGNGCDGTMGIKGKGHVCVEKKKKEKKMSKMKDGIAGRDVEDNKVHVKERMDRMDGVERMECAAERTGSGMDAMGAWVKITRDMFVSKSLGIFRRHAFTNSNYLITEDIMISSYWEINFVYRKISYQMQWLWEYVKNFMIHFFHFYLKFVFHIHPHFFLQFII